jgi:hypothetical protein
MIALVPRDRLIGVMIGPIFWSAYFVISYLVSGTGCSLGYGKAELAGMSSVQLLLLIAGAITAALIAAAAVQAERGRRRAKESAAGAEHAPERRRHQFLYATSLVLCGLSLVGTLWLAMAALIVPVC